MKPSTMKKLKSVLSAALIFSLLFADFTYILPKAAAAPAQTAESAAAVTTAASVPAVSAVSAETTAAVIARSLEELKKSEAVTLSEDGKTVLSVRQSEDDPFTAEELNLLFGVSEVSEEKQAETQRNAKAAFNENLNAKFGLTESQIDQGARLHGDANTLYDELSNFTVSTQNISISEKAQSSILTLIDNGYTNSQAFAAYIASSVLGISVEELAKARAEEIDAELQAKEGPEVNAESAADQAEKEEEQNQEYADLSIKMGVPYSVIEEYMKTSSLTAEELGKAFDQEKEKVYQMALYKKETRSSISAGAYTSVRGSFTESVSETGTVSASITNPRYQSINFSYAPEKILEKPYSYERDADTEVNLNRGTYSYTETDLNIPGVNGLDLNIVRRYDAANAENGVPDAYMDPYYDEYDMFTVGYKPYLIENPGEEDETYTAITNLSQYTFPYNTVYNLFYQTNPELTYSNPNYVLNFEAQYYETAAQYKDSLLPTYHLAYDSYSNPVVICFQSFILGIEPYFSTACTNASIAYNKTVNEFGLGHGWRLGFSSIESYSAGFGGGSKQKLITSEGRTYEIDFTVQAGDSNLVDYELSDLRLENTGNGYTGASYTLFHKNGTIEYFDANGRNIAIVDRYGNAITLEYTLTAGGAVSQIEITDTLNNTILYKDDNITTTTQYINGMSYNARWSLTLNNDLIRTYYLLDGSGVRRLRVVENENSEYTNYIFGVTTYSFNSFISTESGNDVTRKIARLYQIQYPNGEQKLFGTGGEMSERLGYAGYQKYAFVNSIYTFSDEGTYEIRKDLKQYIYGDYSDLSTPVYGVFTYDTVVTEYMCKFVSNAYLTWQTESVNYKFNSAHLKTNEEYYYYPAIQEDQITSFNDYISLVPAAVSNKSTTKKTTFAYNSDNLPTTVNTTYYNFGSATAGMTENYAYSYDNKGNVLTETKPNSQVVTYTYDSDYSIPLTKSYSKDASTVIDAENTLTLDGKSIATSTVEENSVLKSKTEFTYDAAGRLTAEKDYSDATNYVEKQYVYGNGAQVTEAKTLGVRDADDNLVTGSAGYAAGTIVTQAEYNGRGWITSQTDAEGNETEIDYDSTGRITQTTNPDGSYATYVYDVANDTVTYTNELGTELEYRYDPAGNLTGVYDTAGSQLLSSKSYDSLNRLIEETVTSSGQDKTTYYYYDTSGRVTETGTKNESDVFTSQTTYAYLDGSGKATKTVVGDANSPSIVTTSYTDNMGNVTAQGRILNATEYQDTFTYDYVGNRTEGKTAYTNSISGTYTTRYTYDFAGRVTSSTNALGDTAYKTYDWLGNLTTETDPAGSTTLYSYDALGRLLEKQQPFSSNGATTYYAITRYTYDRNGNVTLQKTVNSAPGAALTWAQTGYEYDSRNRLVKATTYDDGTPENYTQYYYDAAGKTLRMYTGLSSPLTITGLDTVSGSDADYSVTAYEYDRFSRLTTLTDPLDQEESYTYDTNGNMLTKTDRDGNVTTYAYDDLGRLTGSSVDAADGAGDASVSLTYAFTGLKRSEANDTGTTTYTYDELGRTVEETTGTTVKAYSYNLGDARTGFNLTVNSVQQMNTTYTYDAMNRLTGTASGTVTAAYDYDVNGNREYVQYNNGLREEYDYNLANLLTTLVNRDGSSNVLSQYDYTYTLDGNQATKTDHDGKVTSYTYDDLGRLTSETETVSAQTVQAYAYTYDDANNRDTLTATGAEAYVTAYDYDLNNRLMTETKTSSTSTDTTTYYYDPNGNQTAKTTESVSDGTGSESGTLTSGVVGSELTRYNGFNQMVETELQGVMASYTYAPSGLRVSKTVNGTTISFVYDGDQTVLELTAGAVTGKYIRGINLVCGVIGGTSYYYLYNGHGDVVQLTDASGEVVKNYDYDAFGNQKEIDSFENDSDGNGVADGWTSLGLTGSMSCDESCSGNCSQKIETSSSLGTIYKYNQTVQPGHKYLFSGYYYLESQGGALSTRVNDDGTNWNLNLGYQYWSGSLGTWQQAGVVFTATTATATLIACYVDTQTCEFYLDGWSLIDLTAIYGAGNEPAAEEAMAALQDGSIKSSWIDSNPFRYCGEYYDKETGRIYLRARYYDPVIGRFVSEDIYWGKAADPLSLNLYTYCLSNPIMYTDPSGLISIDEANVQIVYWKTMYALASKTGDKELMTQASNAANAVRAQVHRNKGALLAADESIPGLSAKEVKKHEYR